MVVVCYEKCSCYDWFKIIHCLEKLTSNIGIIDWYMLNFNVN